MMLTKFQQSIVALLASDITREYTIREISQVLRKNYRNTYESVQELIKNKIIHKKRVGRSDICSLDLKQEETIDSLVGAEELRKLSFKKKHSSIKILLFELISKFKKYTSFFCMVVFGSYASGTARERSDLDLLMILPDIKQKNNFIKEMNLMQITTNVTISPIIISENEFRDMLSSKQEINVGKETIKKHILFYNSQIFWELVKNET
ncbi:nucleotidyltransferase domain-containing protein [Candidatus Woesearchaeota archaeon]|nr:nucleotidyltransferase domain-containing protein [Candidatus Woesearchaeota archaeon]